MENTNFYSKQKRNRMLAGTAALSALTVIFSFTRLGMIPWFSGASITICHIPAILAAILFGLPSGLIVGGVFGVSSLILAATQGTGLDVFFVNPLVSVLPRLALPVVVYLLNSLFLKISEKNATFPYLVGVGITAFLGTMFHSFFVLSMLAILAEEVTFPMVLAVLVGNSLLEAAASVIVCVAVMAVKLGAKKAQKSKLEETEN
ncbi:MAG: ECF transporter S component [Spirochaetaceae bacterium]|nr:ECF transporter S component [Spirochaetaceae bacterium]